MREERGERREERREKGGGRRGRRMEWDANAGYNKVRKLLPPMPEDKSYRDEKHLNRSTGRPPIHSCT